MADIVITLAEILIVVSYLFVDLLLLRIFAALGMTGYVVAGFVAGYENDGMKALILFSFLAAVVNFVQIYLILKEKLTVFLPEEMREIYSETFNFMNQGEFIKIYKLARKREFNSGEIVIPQDAEIESLMLIVKGKAAVYLDNEFITTLSIGEFLGEMSYISGSNTSTSVMALSEKLNCLEWSRVDLEALKLNAPHRFNKFFRAIVTGIVNKLSASNYSLREAKLSPFGGRPKIQS